MAGLAWSTLLVGAACVLGIAGAGGTYALLQDRATLPAGKVTAGTLDLKIDGKPSSDIGTWDLAPATPQARSFSVTNAGTVPATLSAKAAITATAPIGAYTQARLTPVAASTDCRPGLGGAQANLDGYTVAPLDAIAPNETRLYCLELSLRQDTPVTLSGQGVSFTLTVNATQKAN